MRLATIAKITLNRPGRSGGFPRAVSSGMNPQHSFIVVLDDDTPNTLLQKVRELATQFGDGADFAQRIQVSQWNGDPTQYICFRETFHPMRPGLLGTPYAQAECFTALEISGRYFRLDEVSLTLPD